MDLLRAAAERDGFQWNVHRPHTLIGQAPGNAMNMGVTRGPRRDLPRDRPESKALQMRGIIGSAGLWPRTIRFMATSGVDTSPLLTASYPLADATTALDAARDTSRNVKVQIEC